MHSGSVGRAREQLDLIIIYDVSPFIVSSPTTMDDLSGLDWSANQPAKPPPMKPSSGALFYSQPPLHPTPSPLGSGRNTPLSTHSGGTPGPGSGAFKPPPTKASQDSAFASLMKLQGSGSGGSNSGASTANLSLREQQERLEAEKRRKEEEQRKQMERQFGGGQFWDSIGQKSAGSALGSLAPPPERSASAAARDDDDLFAAFNADTKVDNASFYPPPAQPTKAPSPVAALNLSQPSAWKAAPAKVITDNSFAAAEDDDPFGLNQLGSKAPSSAAPLSADVDGGEDDDLLGDLARPVEEVRRKKQQAAEEAAAAKSKVTRPEPGKPLEDVDSDSDADVQPAPRRRGGGGGRSGGGTKTDDPFDAAVAQLTDLGFSAEDAGRALTESGGGPTNVQAAAGFLLDEAHRKAKQESRAKNSPAPGGGAAAAAAVGASRGRRDGGAAWMRDDVIGSRDSSQGARPGGGGGGVLDDDFAKTAAAVGSNLLKTANSLWRTGQKKVQKAVSDFQQQDADPSQPKWMRSAQTDRMYGAGEAGEVERERPDNATDEAMMLESGMRPGRKAGRQASEPRMGLAAGPGSLPSSCDQSPAVSAPSTGRSTPLPKWQQQQPSLIDPRARLSKLALEEQGAQAYVSPARRRKATTPQPEQQQAKEPEPDLLFSDGPPVQERQPALPTRPAQQKPPSRPSGSSSSRPSTQPPSRTITPSPAIVARPKPVRQVPPLAPSALAASTSHRLAGTAHFKRGDYAAAHASYTAALQPLPPQHPLAALVLTNRALTAIRVGEPRQAVADAEAAAGVIGEGKGEGEVVVVAVGGGDAPLQDERRDLKDVYGKALARKAEALEQLERWQDAGNTWQLAVESGVGGALAARGRERCAAALAPKPKPAPKPAAAARPAAARPRPAAAKSAASSDAVQRLREAHEAAAREDDEKFQLGEKVDARVAAWRDGKRDNLRALLGSLDLVMWDGSGWKKVGLHDLVIAAKVKVVYMKAIARCHPDKVSSVLTVLSLLVAKLLMLHVAADSTGRLDRGQAHRRIRLQHSQRELGQVQGGEWHVDWWTAKVDGNGAG